MVKSCTLEDIIQVFEVSEHVDASTAAHFSRLREVGALIDADTNELFELNIQMSTALENGDLPKWAVFMVLYPYNNRPQCFFS